MGDVRRDAQVMTDRGDSRGDGNVMAYLPCRPAVPELNWVVSDGYG